MAVQSVVFMINGTSHTLTLDASTGKYTGTITAPAETSGSNNSGQGPGVGANASGKGYYPGTVVVTDDAGNVTTVDVSDSTFGNNLKLKVLEKTAPTVQITSPGADARLTNSKPSINITATDSGSGIKQIFVKMDSGSAEAMTSGVTVNGATATAVYTPSTALAEGTHTVTVYATDWDGNTSESVSRSFIVDTVAPVLNVTSPADAMVTNQTTVLVAGTTNDSTSSPVTITIAVGAKSYTPSVGTGGAFSQSVELGNGINAITITATDAAGLATTVTRTVTLDQGAPVITAITMVPNPVDGGQTYVISVTVTD